MFIPTNHSNENRFSKDGQREDFTPYLGVERRVRTTGDASLDVPGGEVEPGIEAANQEVRRSVGDVIAQPLHVERQRKERSIEYLVRREKNEVYYPVQEIGLGLIRCSGSDPVIHELVQKIVSGNTRGWPSQLFVSMDGEDCLDLSVLEIDDQSLIRSIDNIPGLRLLLTILDRDLTLSGKSSVRVEQFKRKRKKVAEKVAEDVRTYGAKWVDFADELAGSEGSHEFQDETVRQSAELLQDYCRRLVNRLFKVLGLSNVTPVTYLSRNKTANAFVWSSMGEEGLKDALDLAAKGEVPLQLPIYINFGIFSEISHPDELAGILAHEFAHLLQPTFARGSTSEESQRLEYDADKTSLHICDAAGFNPRGLIDYFKRQKDSGLMQRLGFSSHPDNRSRIIELEKEYHRKDLPLINSSKRLGSIPVNIRDAIDRVAKALELKEDTADIGASERSGNLDETLQAEQGPQLFFREGFNRQVDDIARRRLERDMLHQEMVHGTLGHREALLKMLQCAVLTLQMQEHNKNPQVKYSLNLHKPHQFKETADAPEISDYFNVRKVEGYLREGQTTEKYEDKSPLNTTTFLSEMEALGMDSEKLLAALPQTMEEWITSDNSLLEPFWRVMGSQNGVPSQKARLLFLEVLLGWYMFFEPSSDYSNRVFMTIDKTEETMEMEKLTGYESVSEDKGYLDKLPAGMRAHKRKEEPVRKKIEAEKPLVKTSNLFYRGLLVLKTNPDLRSLNPEREAPLIRDLAVTLSEKSIDAYQQMLRMDGAVPASPEILRFVLFQLYHKNESYGRQEGNVILEGLSDPSISRLDEAVRLLESKHFGNTFFDPITKANGEIQQRLVADYTVLIAFALKPRNTEENVLQKKYLARIADDRFLRFAEYYRGATLYQHVEDGTLELFQPEYVATYNSYDGGKGLSLKIDNPPQQALWKMIEQNFISDLENAMGGEGLAVSGLESRAEDVVAAEAILAPVRTKQTLLQRIFRHVEEDPRQAARRSLSEKLAKAVMVIRKNLQTVYEEVLPTHRMLVTHYEVEKQWLAGGNECPPILNLMFAETARTMADHFSAYGDIGTDVAKIEGMLKDLFRKTCSVEDRMLRFEEIEHLARPNHCNARLGDDSSVPVGATKMFYRDKKQICKRSEDGFDVPRNKVDEWLAGLAGTKPEAGKLLALLRDEKLVLNEGLSKLCLGSFISYDLLGNIRDWDLRRGGWIYKPERKAANMPLAIKAIRLAAALYHDEWKNIEEYKRLDEYISNWEWLYANPVIQKMPAKDVRDYQLSDGHMVYFVKTYGDYLGKRYQVKQAGKDILFSWPLFLTDLWEGKLQLEGLMSREDTSRMEIFTIFMKRRLYEFIIDGNNVETVKKMQPGFFKEFILAEKLKLSGLRGLDNIEKWLPHFTSFEHEASETNQINLKMEQVRSEIVERRKKALISRAVDIVLTEVPKEIRETICAVIEPDLQLLEIDCNIRQDYYKKTDPSLQGIIAKHRKEILSVYKRLIEEEQASTESKRHGNEEDIYVFSDHVIENDRSRLEVGPVYRYRLAAQPLMDWHVKELRLLSSPVDFEGCLARVDNVFPAKHPLKDLYLKNQLNTEIWQMLREEFSADRLEEMGISLGSTNVDLLQALENFSDYREMSFLKRYTLFKMEGLHEVFDALPESLTGRILERMSFYLQEKISPASAPVLRRLMFALEEKSVWPHLRKRRKEGDEAVFEQYLAYILERYPDPSLERDSLIESIGVDLALTPDEISKVWSLRYEQQVRWPEEKEALSIKAQFEASQKMRFYLSMMKQPEKTAYLLWLVGGSRPLSFALTAHETGISLEGRKEAFWQMKANERRELLYDILAGQDGLFMPYGNSSYRLFETDAERPFLQIDDRMAISKYLVEELFNLVFQDLAINDDLPAEDPANVKAKDMVRIVFTGQFNHQHDPVRRAELLINVIDAIGTARISGKKLGAPELIRMMAEQGGVVLIKFGQVLSEQPNLLPASIKGALSELKDNATMTSKKSELTYLQATGWVDEDQPGVAEIGDVQGSASIKQARSARLKNGRVVAVKTKKPNIDKYYRDDLLVVERILVDLQFAGHDVPSFLITEVQTLIEEEMDFEREMNNQRTLNASLVERKAVLPMRCGDENFTIPVETAEQIQLSLGSLENDAQVGLIVETFANGLSLKEVQHYQHALRENDQVKIEKLRRKMEAQFPPEEVEIIERRYRTLDLGKLQATIAMELLRQIVNGGVFHADPHSGNIFLDLRPYLHEGRVFQGKAILIDNGSMGYSRSETMPVATRKDYPENYMAGADFRDFLSAMFSSSNRNDVLVSIINKYTGLAWETNHLEELIDQGATTQVKAKKIFFEILKAVSKQPEAKKNAVDQQFRFLLKTIATSADHFDKLKEQVTAEMMEMFENPTAVSEEQMAASFFSQLQMEGLLNFELAM